MRIKGKGMLHSVQASMDSKAESEKKDVASNENVSDKGTYISVKESALPADCKLEFLKGNII
jgi:hypothetical protein